MSTEVNGIVSAATPPGPANGPLDSSEGLPAEDPVDVRTTCNDIASGVAKVGAFAGAAVLPALVDSMGLSHMVLIPAGVARAGARFTLMLREPPGSRLEEISEPPAPTQAARTRRSERHEVPQA